MTKKTIIFEGGLLNNQFREVYEEIHTFYYLEYPPYKDRVNSKECEVVIDKKAYVATNKYYGSAQVFVPKEDFDKGIQMIKDETNTEATKAE